MTGEQRFPAADSGVAIGTARGVTATGVVLPPAAQIPDLSHPAQLPPAIAEQISRLRLERGRVLGRRSPAVALGAGALALAVTLAAGIATVWVCLHRVPTLVMSTNRTAVLSFVGTVFVVVVLAGLVGYATARWVHARSIASRGKVGATGVGLVVSVVAISGLVLAVRPWSFPQANVLAAPPLVAAQDLARRGVAGGMVVYSRDTPLAYLLTNAGRWIETPVPPSAVDTVVSEIPTSGPASTLDGITQGIGGGQLTAMQTAKERLWFVAAALTLWASVATVVQRRLWRRGPWSVPAPSDVLHSMEWGLDQIR